MDKTPKVYIAGKLADYAPQYNINKKRMMQIAIEVYNAGFSVFVPSMIDNLAMMDDTKDWNYDDYFDNSQPWLEVADAVFLVPGWEESKGTQREIETANKLDIPVFECINCMFEYFNQDDIAKSIGSELDKRLTDLNNYYYES